MNQASGKATLSQKGRPSCRAKDLTVHSRAARLKVIAVIAFALAIDYLVYGIVIPLTPFSPAAISKDEELTILAGCYGLGTLLSTPVFGYIGDRFGCRRPMIAGALLLAVATALLAHSPNFTLMAAARLLQGVAAAATWTSGLATVARYYPTNRVQMMGYALMGSTGGSVIGPVLAGGLHAVGGYALPFYVVLGIIALEFFSLLAFLPPDAIPDGPQANVLTLLTDGAVLVPAFAVVLAASAWTIVEALVPIHLARGGAKPTEIGGMFTMTTLIYGLSAPLVAWIVGRIGIRRTAILGTVAMAMTIPLVAASYNLFVVAAAAAAVNISYAMLLNPQSAELGDIVESRGLHCYCAVYSVYNVAYAVGTIVTSAVASALLRPFSTQIVFLCLGCAMLLTIPVLARKGRSPAAVTPAGAT
jgi:MFS transporter, DHA1 family, solute carrier family 18 (vesicular amine transporter), member 1/2